MTSSARTLAALLATALLSACSSPTGPEEPGTLPGAEPPAIPTPAAEPQVLNPLFPEPMDATPWVPARPEGGF